MRYLLTLLLLTGTLQAGPWIGRTVRQGGDDPVLAIDFNVEGVGTISVVRDAVISGNDGTTSGSPTNQAAAGPDLTDCMEFDGVNDYVVFPDNSNAEILPNVTPYTIFCCVKPGRLNVYQRIYGSQGGATSYRGTTFGLDDTGKLYFLIRSLNTPLYAAGVITSSALTQDEWQTVAVTYDGSKLASGMVLYVNGVVASYGQYGSFSSAVSGANFNSGYDIGLGADGNAGGGPWLGAIDNFLLYYNRVLSAAEIAGLHNQYGRN